MKDIGLAPSEMEQILRVFHAYPEIIRVHLYGSRAMGTFRPESDIDLAIEATEELNINRIAHALDELPLPYKFDVKALGEIRHAPLRERIDRVGICLYERDASQTITAERS